MNRVRYTELIDSFVDGEMDEASKRKFEAELSINRDLALEFRLENDLSKALMQEDLIDFRSKCIEAQNDMNFAEKKMVKIVHITRRYWYAAASVLLVGLIIGGMLIFNPRDYSAEKLFKMYYKSGETIGLSRSGNVDMAEALRYFSKNDFMTAESLFDKILVSDPGNMAVKYYSGISNIEIKDYSKAVLLFESIINDGDNLYVENAEWYLGLTHLAAGEVEQADVIFNKISAEPGHYYRIEAKSILEKIGTGEKNKNFLNKVLFLILPF
jgi:tetratricopeptide (TPR) repeat protein